MINVLFVCTGNICRSPMAEYVFLHRVEQAGLTGKVGADSAGISDEEVGSTIHTGTVRMLREHLIPHNDARPARQIMPGDYTAFQYLLAMDRGHLSFLQRYAAGPGRVVDFFLADAFKAGLVKTETVPDPWYDGQYERTFDLVAKGTLALLDRIRAEHRL